MAHIVVRKPAAMDDKLRNSRIVVGGKDRGIVAEKSEARIYPRPIDRAPVPGENRASQPGSSRWKTPSSRTRKHTRHARTGAARPGRS